MKRFPIYLTFLFCFLNGVFAQELNDNYVENNFDKQEVYIDMRDGTRLFTAIYTPKDTSKSYPILLNRTPYTVAPYGPTAFKTSLGNFPEIMEAGYIFVYQDVRGKWMSEGSFENIRPTRSEKNSQPIDESTDTYDTIDWLVRNIKGNNGNVGMYGISYPGFYSTAALIDSHPALKAVSPQAPVTDWFIGDDFRHGGALFLADAFRFMYNFDAPRPEPITDLQAPKSFDFPNDLYQFFMDNPTLKELKDKYLDHTVKFWDDLAKHQTLDTFWQARTITNHLNDIKPAVMIVGGLFDAEDTYGTFETYKQIESRSPINRSFLVIGPWFHGGWVRSEGDFFGDIQFDEKTSLTYQQNFELPFFEYHLKGIGSFDPKEANIFVTGSNEWTQYEQWPPSDLHEASLYLSEKGSLTSTPPANDQNTYIEYSSDPANPVPFQEGVITDRSREYMIADQRFAANRPDVVVFQTPPLTEDLLMLGPITADLHVSMSGTDADFVVKLIDVYPDSSSASSPTNKEVVMPNYQMLVRADILRGRFRNSYSDPEPFTPEHVTPVSIKLPDVAHTFKKGHRVMVQIQHSWFPLVDRNPNQFIDIFQAKAEDYINNQHRIYFDKEHPSTIRFGTR